MSDDPSSEPASQSRESIIRLAAVVGAMLVFGLDMLLGPDVAAAVLHVSVVWVALFSQRRWTVWSAAVVCSLLTGTGYLLSPDGGELWKVLANRGVALLAVWLTAGFGLAWRHHVAQGVSMLSYRSTPSLVALGQPEQSANLTRALWTIIIVTLAIHAVFMYLGKTLLIDFRWPHHPVHAALEMMGAAIAIWVAFMLMMLERRRVGTSFNVWIAGALIGMGLLDGFHALVHAGHIFVWLHSTATLFGGVLFAAVWLPDSCQKRVAGWWPWAVAAGATVFGLVSLAFSEYMPPMLAVNERDEVFTLWAQGLNLTGGGLMFSAAAKMVLTWRKTHNVDDLLFCLHCFLFGAAAVMFEHSQLWDLPWWGWHVLRLLAYAVALWFVVVTDLQDANSLRRRAIELTRLSAIVDSSNDAILGMNLNGVVFSWNKGSEKLYGYSASEMIGQPATQIVPQNRRDELPQILDGIQKGTYSAEPVETVRRCKDDTLVDVSLTVSPIRDAQGKLVGVSAIARDITTQKLAADSANQQESLVTSLLDSTAEGIYGVDLEGNCIWVNPSCYTLLGYASPEDFLGLNMHNLIHHHRPDGSPYPADESRIYKAASEGHGVHVDDEVLWRKDGSAFPAEYWAHPVYRDERIVGSVVTFLDITERKRLEQRYRSIVDSAMDAVVVIDANGAVVNWNPQAEILFGRAANDAIGKQVDELIIPERFRDQHNAGLKQYLESGHAQILNRRLEVTAVRRGGEEFPVELSLSANRVSDGWQFNAFVRDITEQRRLRQAQQELNETLERRVQERTAELQRSNADLAQFAYVASHDLQEPLRAVVGYSQLLQKDLAGSDNGDTASFLGYIVEGGQRMQVLISDLLEYSRVDRKGQPIESTDVAAVISDAVRNLDAAIRESGAEIECGPMPHAMVDGRQFTQLFQNLIGNAIKYRGDRVPRIEVMCDDDGDNWVFTVRDNGIGIAPQFHEQIFVIFKRLHTRDEYAGTGIGLALCQRIVERHGGQIHVESRPQQGSTFSITIPKTARRLIDVPSDE